MIMIRFFITGLILIVMVSLAQAQEEKKREFDNLPYEELQKLIEGAKSKSEWPNMTDKEKTMIWSNMIDIAETMIKKQPDDPEPYYWLAYAQLKKGELDNALREFAEALGLDANYLEAYIGRAIAYTKKKESALAKEEILLAAERCLSAIREIQTSQIPDISELKDNLKSPNFFIQAIEREVPPEPRTMDRFLCPLTKPKGPPPVLPFGILSESEQRKKRDEMKELCEKIAEDIAEGDNDAAREKFRSLKAIYDDYVLTGKISIDAIRIEMENIWKEAKRRFHPPILRAESEKLTKEAGKSLIELRTALDNKKLEVAEQINRDLEKSLKERTDNTDPEFGPLKKLAEEYDRDRQDIYKRVAALRELRDKISPHIYLRMTITGLGVESVAYLEIDFGGKLEKHVLKENEPIPIPKEFLAELTLTKIEDDRIVVKYRKEDVELADDITFPAPVAGASESGSKAP